MESSFEKLKRIEKIGEKMYKRRCLSVNFIKKNLIIIQKCPIEPTIDNQSIVVE